MEGWLTSKRYQYVCVRACGSFFRFYYVHLFTAQDDQVLEAKMGFRSNCRRVRNSRQTLSRRQRDFGRQTMDDQLP
jgi:hypothetical protein